MYIQSIYLVYAHRGCIPPKARYKRCLEWTHEKKCIKRYVDGTLEDSLGEEWMKIGEYQPEQGQVKDYHKRKSMEVQQLERQEFVNNAD
jgi:hypothetical protein